MKKILISVIALFAVLMSVAQAPTKNLIVSDSKTSLEVRNTLVVDTLLVLPQHDTVFSYTPPTRSLVYKSSDKVVYMYDGTKWSPFSNAVQKAAGGIARVGDSIYLSGVINATGRSITGGTGGVTFGFTNFTTFTLGALASLDNNYGTGHYQVNGPTGVNFLMDQKNVVIKGIDSINLGSYPTSTTRLNVNTASIRLLNFANNSTEDSILLTTNTGLLKNAFLYSKVPALQRFLDSCTALRNSIGSGGGGGANNFTSSLAYNTSTGVFTLGRTGLSNLTVTIPPGVTDTTALLRKSNNLSDLASVSTAKVNLSLDQVNNTTDANKPVSTAQATAIALKINISDSAAMLSTYLRSAIAATTYVSLTGTYSNPAWITALAYSKLTGTPTTVSAAGLTDAVTLTGTQTLTNKTLAVGSNHITGVASRVAVFDITTSDLISSAISTTELSQLSGVSSNVQTQLNGKVSLSGSYADPSWLISLNANKLTGSIAAARYATTTIPTTAIDATGGASGKLLTWSGTWITPTSIYSNGFGIKTLSGGTVEADTTALVTFFNTFHPPHVNLGSPAFYSSITGDSLKFNPDSSFLVKSIRFSSGSLFMTINGVETTVATGIGSGGSGSADYTVATAVATANYTTPASTSSYTKLSDLTGQANRNVVLPSAPVSGRSYVYKNLNTATSGFDWFFTGGTVKDYGGNSVTTVNPLTVYTLVYDGTNFNINN